MLVALPRIHRKSEGKKTDFLLEFGFLFEENVLKFFPLHALEKVNAFELKLY